MSVGARILGSVWSLAAIISIAHGSFLSSTTTPEVSSTQTSVGQSAVTDQNTTTTLSTTNTSQNQKPTLTTKPVSKPTPQETAKTKFEAELQQVKDHTIKLNAQQQLQFEKEYIQYDKPGLLSMEPAAQDVGFAGDLFVQTDKNTTKQYNSVGWGVTYSQASGMYWVVQVTMNNAGMNPMTVSDNMFTLSADGRTYAPDTAAEMTLTNEKPIVMETINPLEDVTGYLVFDMPTNMNPSDVKLQVQNGFNQVALSIS